MLLVTTPYVEGKEIANVLGLVQGSAIRSNFMGKAVVSSIKRIAGKETQSSEDIVAEGREESLGRLADEAERLGGNAVVDIRMKVNDLPGDCIEFFAYGTAVKIA